MFGDWFNGSARIRAYIGLWSIVVSDGSMWSGAKVGRGAGFAGDDSICRKDFCMEEMSQCWAVRANLEGCALFRFMCQLWLISSMLDRLGFVFGLCRQCRWNMRGRNGVVIDTGNMCWRRCMDDGRCDCVVGVTLS